MAKVFDPGTSIQMSISGNIFSLLFVLFLFVTDSHLVLIRLFASSMSWYLSEALWRPVL
jgi:flagellar biosynthetic protein FliR